MSIRLQKHHKIFVLLLRLLCFCLFYAALGAGGRSVARARLVVTSHTPLNIRITAMPFIRVKLSMPRVMPTMVATMGWR